MDLYFYLSSFFSNFSTIVIEKLPDSFCHAGYILGYDDV